MMYSGNQAKEIARLNKLLIDVERERLEIQGRAATIESTHISLQEANTRLERELAEAKGLSRRVGDWHLERFGDVDPVWPLLVAVGELGELTQSHVKETQTHLKRYEGTDWTAEVRDAIGDTVVALMAYTARRGWDFNVIVRDVFEHVSTRDDPTPAERSED